MTSDKAAANFSDRSLLKNLGHWLGMITLAKNKPILYTVRFCILVLLFHYLVELLTAFELAQHIFLHFSGSGSQISASGGLRERPARASVCGSFCGQGVGVQSTKHGD